MKITITESQLENIIKEFDTSRHYRKRLNLRLKNTETYDVIAFYRYEYDKKIIIGKHSIPKEAKIITKDIMTKITDPVYGIPHNLALIVKLYEFKINLNNVTFIGTPEEQMKYKKMFQDRQNRNIFLQTDPDEKGRTSHGRFLVCIVRGGGIATIFLIRNETVSVDEVKKYMLRKNIELDEVIYIPNPQTELETYIDIDYVKSNPPQQPTEPPTEQPQLTDKEKRLLAYNEKMRKKQGKK